MSDYTGMMSETEFLEHFGKKGMKWGVRNESKPTVKIRTEDLPSVKTSTGETLHIQGSKVPVLARVISHVSPRARANISDSSSFTLKNSDGKTVGELSLYKESPTSLNVIWVGVNEKARGHGYATAAMKSAVSFAQKQNLKTVTLEVPGRSPDARHIYEKLGFKVHKEADGVDDFWGGLTEMKLDLDTLKHEQGGIRVTDILTGMMTEDDFLEHAGDIKKGNTMAEADLSGMLSEDDFLEHVGYRADMTEDEQSDFLEHYGKKGMKWGQRLAEANLGVAAKARTSTGNAKSRKEGSAERSAAIDAARKRTFSGQNKAAVKDAKSAAKAAKGTDGAAAAKAALRAARDKKADDKHDAALAKAGNEAVVIALGGSYGQLVNMHVAKKAVKNS